VSAAIVRPRVKTALAVGLDDALRALVAAPDAFTNGGVGGVGDDGRPSAAEIEAHAAAYGLTPQPAGPGEEPERRGGAWLVTWVDVDGDPGGAVIELYTLADGSVCWCDLGVTPESGDLDDFEDTHNFAGYRYRPLDHAGNVVPRGGVR
jgi:hypothetical protein